MIWLQALLVSVAALCCAADAAAHATLLSANPADGASLREAPAELVLQFDEPVAPLAMQLVDDAGTTLRLGAAARADAVTVRIPLPVLRKGAFIFSYRVTSVDSHPVSGSIAFTVGEVATGSHRAIVAAAPSDSALGPALFVARALRDLLLLVAGGAALFAVCVGAFPFQRAALCIAGSGAAAASVLELGMQGAALLAQPALSAAAFRAAASTTAGASSAGILIGAAAIILGTSTTRPRARQALLCVGGLTVPASLALTGHAASAHPAWHSMAAVAAHALTAAFWLGSLVALLLMTRTGSLALVPALHRFSAIATPAVAVLLAAGVLFATMQIGSIDELVHSRYGKLVLVKAMLLVALLVIAARNRFVLTPRLERSDAMGRTALARSISAELALMLLVVAVAAVLSRTPAQTDAGITTELSGASPYRGRLTVSPALAGRNAIVVELRDRDNRPLDPDEARLRLTNGSAGMEPIERPLIREAAGRFRHEGGELSLRGTWTISVDARVGEFDRFKLQAPIEIR